MLINIRSNNPVFVEMGMSGKNMHLIAFQYLKELGSIAGITSALVRTISDRSMHVQ